MRVAILSESIADESALRILVDAALGIKTTPVATNLRSWGWNAVCNNLGIVAKFLHYRTDADGLVVVADSNHTHLAGDEPKNRLKELQVLAKRCREQLGTLPGGRIPLKIAVGVAAPAIEVWWLCKKHPHITESAWEKGLAEKRDPYSKLGLKKMLYGKEYWSLEWMTQKMAEAAQMAATDLPYLERSFPNGFGSLIRELRNWRRIN